MLNNMGIQCGQHHCLNIALVHLNFIGRFNEYQQGCHLRD